MIRKIGPGPATGEVTVPASKSVVHRLLICAALSQKETTVFVGATSKDIDATVSCLTALGAVFDLSESGVIRIIKGVTYGGKCVMNCGESGSTLRFLVPVAAALGKECEIKMEGLLPKRPHDILLDAVRQKGVVAVQKDDRIFLSGKLSNGIFVIPGNISSQYISGLLFATPLLDGDSTIKVTGRRESVSYISMTEDALKESGISFDNTEEGYTVKGNQSYGLCGNVKAEKDWSSAAFFLCMGAMSETGVTLRDMNLNSRQGDKKILQILKESGADVQITGSDITVKKGTPRPMNIDAQDIPDLVPVLCAYACSIEGETVIYNAQRLRLKESDRIATTCEMIRALGGKITETPDGMIVSGTGSLSGGKTDSHNDHRIAMSAATASSVCTGPVTILDAGCVAKSYPDFYRDLADVKKNLVTEGE